MKVCLFGLGLTLLCSVLAVEDSRIEEVLGQWHNVAIASDCKCIMKHMSKAKMTVLNLSAQEPGTVTLDTSLPTPGGCKKISMKFTKQDNGHYYHTCEWGDKTIEEVDTTQEDALTVKASHEKNGKICRVWTLLTRERKINEGIVSAFVQEAEAAGFTEQQIKIMPAEVACIESQ